MHVLAYDEELQIFYSTEMGIPFKLVEQTDRKVNYTKFTVNHAGKVEVEIPCRFNMKLVHESKANQDNKFCKLRETGVKLVLTKKSDTNIYKDYEDASIEDILVLANSSLYNLVNKPSYLSPPVFKTLVETNDSIQIAVIGRKISGYIINIFSIVNYSPIYNSTLLSYPGEFDPYSKLNMQEAKLIAY